jgi:cyclopropane fatty-acyl-phospholipid synthase-like methyltransferase
MTWEIVDRGWGDAATVWAYTMEPRFWPEFDQVLRDTGVGEGTSHLDVACVSGFASLMASHCGATVHGLGASDRLLAIAARRAPNGDLAGSQQNNPEARHCSMATIPSSGQSCKREGLHPGV